MVLNILQSKTNDYLALIALRWGNSSLEPENSSEDHDFQAASLRLRWENKGSDLLALNDQINWAAPSCLYQLKIFLNRKFSLQMLRHPFLNNLFLSKLLQCFGTQSEKKEKRKGRNWWQKKMERQTKI